jgi:hypothetical protein
MFLVNLFESYDDARIYERKIKNYGFGVYFSSMNIQWIVKSGDNSLLSQYRVFQKELYNFESL